MVPTTSPAATRSPTATVAATGSTELRSPSSCRTVSTGRSTTTPAKVTTPARGARTGVPTGASRSTPRCPAAHGTSGPSNGSTTTTGSTGACHASTVAVPAASTVRPGPTSTARARGSPAATSASSRAAARARRGSEENGTARACAPRWPRVAPGRGRRGTRRTRAPVEDSHPARQAPHRGRGTTCAAPPRRRASRTSRHPGPTAGPGPGARPVDSSLRPVRAGRHRASSPTPTPPPPRRERCVRRAGAGSGPGPTGPGVGKGVAPGVLPGREAPTTGRAGAPRRARDHCARPRRGRAEGPPWPS